VAVVWCRCWHHHCVAVDVAIAAVILPAATACNCIAHRATALAAALCIVQWHFSHAKGCCGVAPRAVALFFVPRHCASCHSLVLRTAALRFIPQHLASCHSIMLHAVASCIMLGILLHSTDIALCAAALVTALHIKEQHHASNLCAVYFFH